jgi:hypothetical protein
MGFSLFIGKYSGSNKQGGMLMQEKSKGQFQRIVLLQHGETSDKLHPAPVG